MAERFEVVCYYCDTTTILPITHYGRDACVLCTRRYSYCRRCKIGCWDADGGYCFDCIHGKEISDPERSVMCSHCEMWDSTTEHFDEPSCELCVKRFGYCPQCKGACWDAHGGLCFDCLEGEYQRFEDENPSEDRHGDFDEEDSDYDEEDSDDGDEN
jgi:hypothetical protein